MMSLSDLLVMNQNIDVLDGLLYAVIGFIFVFLGIAILIGVLYLVGYFMDKNGGKMPTISFKKKTKEEKTDTSVVPAAVAAPVATSINEEVPDEVKAAIMAAIMAYYSVEKPKCEFVVKKIKRI